MSSVAAQSLGPFLSNRFGDRYFYEINRNVFNYSGSDALYHKHFGKNLFVPHRFYLLVGTDSGMLLRWLKNNGLADGSRYLVVELAPVIERLREAGDLDDLPERMAVIAPEELPAHAVAFQFESYVYVEAADMCESLAAADAFLPEYRELSLNVLEWMKSEVFRIRGLLGAQSFVVAQLENLAENMTPARCLVKAFSGKTAVLLGGGPSLDEVLPWVVQNEDNLVILAVSRIARKLLECGLAPHFIFSVDPQEISFEVSREMLQLKDSTIFIHSYHVSPLLLSQWQGRSLYLGPLFPWKSQLDKPNLTVHGPTVTNVALAVAQAMGCSQVVFGGIDFCFSAEGMTHAQGSNENQAGPILGGAGLWVETNSGRLAETAGAYRTALDIMAEQARHAVAAGCRLINPAPGAARIADVEHVELEAVRFEPLEQSPVACVLEKIPTNDSAQRLNHYRMLTSELERAEAAMKKMANLAQKALDCNDGLFGRGGKKADFKYKLRMDKIEKKMNREFADFVPLIKQYGIRDFLKMTRPDSNSRWSDEDIERAGRIYYEAFSRSAKELLTLIVAAEKRLQSRILEEESAPDLNRLAGQWRADGQFGRYRVWQGRQIASPEFAADERALFARLEEEFQALLSKQDTRQIAHVKMVRSLDGLRGKIEGLFRRGAGEELRKTLKGLECHGEQDKAAPLQALARGYLAELTGEPLAALAHYQELIGDTFQPVTEDALKRIAVISLDESHAEYALLALECLANAAAVYKPQYAGLLQALGRHQEAADAYVDYLDVVPDDLNILLRLGQLYQTIGAEDAARQIFLMVLEKDQNNAAAKALLAEKV